MPIIKPIDAISTLIKLRNPDKVMMLGDHCLYLQAIPPSVLGLGVDPWPLLKLEKLPPNLKVYPVTSDYFFHSPYMTHDLSLDMVVLTGYRKFEQLLRDIVFSEKLCKNTSMIVIHGTAPHDENEASRNTQPQGQVHVGDGFKCLAALKKYRPDLKLSTCTDVGAGLTIIENPDETNHVIQNTMVHVVTELINQKLEERDTSTDMTFDAFLKSHQN